MKKPLFSISVPARRWLLALALSTGAATAAQAQNNVGIGTNAANPAPSAVLDLSSSTQGLLAPRMNATQRNAIASPATGLLVYQTDGTAGFYVYNGTAWTVVGGSSGGTTGPVGPQGPAGATGPAGPAGPMGTAGTAGPKGDKGDAGTTGPAGPAGTMGAAGAPGAAGPKGDMGVAGLPGATGPQGAKGDMGAAGVAGAPGAMGTPGATGPAGTTGPAGPKGDNGAPGAAGPAGVAGATGPQGAKGDKGDAGLAGATGPQGAKGDTGAAGPAGTIGTPGAPGQPGAQGPAGQGVPTGGTAGQVLTKVNATDYNTQWSTPTGGGTFPSIELITSVTSSQTVTPLNGSNNYTPLVFSSSNGTGAALTNGNTWNGSVFTVGSSGAGTYQVTAQMMNPAGATQANGVSYFLDKNNTIGNTPSSTGPYALSTYNLNNFNNQFYRFCSTISTIIYLAAGDQITFRAQTISSSTAASTSADGSSNLQIVRLK